MATCHGSVPSKPAQESLATSPRIWKKQAYDLITHWSTLKFMAGMNGSTKKVAKKPLKKLAGKSAKQLSLPTKAIGSRGDLAPDRIAAILKALDEAYPSVECALTIAPPGNFSSPPSSPPNAPTSASTWSRPELFKPLPHPGRHGQSNPARTRSPHPHHRLLPQQGQIHSRRGPQDRQQTSTAKSRKPSPNSSPSPAQPAKPPTSSSASASAKPKA